jgi:hypothetical protein
VENCYNPIACEEDEEVLNDGFCQCSKKPDTCECY